METRNWNNVNFEEFNWGHLLAAPSGRGKTDHNYDSNQFQNGMQESKFCWNFDGTTSKDRFLPMPLADDDSAKIIDGPHPYHKMLDLPPYEHFEHELVGVVSRSSTSTWASPWDSTWDFDCSLLDKQSQELSRELDEYYGNNEESSMNEVDIDLHENSSDSNNHTNISANNMRASNIFEDKFKMVDFGEAIKRGKDAGMNNPFPLNLYNLHSNTEDLESDSDTTDVSQQSKRRRWNNNCYPQQLDVSDITTEQDMGVQRMMSCAGNSTWEKTMGLSSDFPDSTGMFFEAAFASAKAHTQGVFQRTRIGNMALKNQEEQLEESMVVDF